ncbi:MAG: AsmA family protein [Alphaproteobacteria bacterium]|nr:AsmA family protein [Alphaproteobacteria bacterium]
MKARTRRKLFWTFVAMLLSAIAAVIIAPPFIDMGRLKPQIESAVLAQTGMNIKIGGSVRLSLVGRATLSARDVSVSDYKGRIEYVSFRIPYRALLDLNMAAHTSTIILEGANFHIDSLAPTSIPARLVFRNGIVTFKGKTYDHINGVFRNGIFNGTLRTDEHKYTLESDGQYFIITNPNVRLNLKGQLSTDNAGNVVASGKISLDTNDINRFFAFSTTLVPGRVKFQSDFEWADQIFKFHNISGETLGGDFNGDVEFGRNHWRINMVANNVDFDLSFLDKNPGFLHNSDINFAGNGKFRTGNIIPVFGNKYMTGDFNRIRFVSSADADTINIKELDASGNDFNISARGQIKDGTALGLDTIFQNPNSSVRCILNGKGHNWSCSRWDYADSDFSAHGILTVTKDGFDINFNSNNYDFSRTSINSQFSSLPVLLSRKHGTVKFAINDEITGMAQIDGKNINIEYGGHSDTSLSALPARHDIINLLPESLLRSRGTIHSAVIKSGKLLAFDFERFGRNNSWRLTVGQDGDFQLEIDARHLLSAQYPNIETKFLHDNLPMLVTGRYSQPYISDLNIVIRDNNVASLAGKFDGNVFDLNTEFIDLDALLNPEYIQNYDAEKYVTAEPLTFPFAINMSLTLSADKVKFRDEEYRGFVYSLKPNSQKMSITDNARGNLLVTIEKNMTRYNMLVRLNKFEILGMILPSASPLNIADTMLTARATFTTHGITSADFWRNITGDIDAAFDGGTLIGFDTDKFYDRAGALTRMNAEYAISDAFEGGYTKLRTLNITGLYENGGFKTTAPLTATTRHTEYSGQLQTMGGYPSQSRGGARISAQLRILLRGTSPVPVPISLNILPNGEREFSLSEIMRTLDPDFLREFVKLNNRF